MTEGAARVVVGMDGSGPSRAALRWAVERAAGDRLPIVLVHVVVRNGDDSSSADPAVARREGELLLAEAIARLEGSAPGPGPSSQLVEGALAASLAAAVAPGDLLVVGTHKMGYLHGRVLGSRSVQIAAAMPCDVVVVPDVELRLRRGVVAGIDRAATAGAIGRAAAREAQRLGGELLLLQAARPKRDVSTSDAVTAAIEAARAAAPELEVRGRVAHWDPATALLDAAGGRALLVLGPGSTDADRAPVGSVLHDVLLNTSAPVLVLRGPGRAERGSGPAAPPLPVR